MRETVIERKLRDRIRELGGLCLKWESPSYTGVPDRLILLPRGNVLMVETKAPGKKERARQRYVQGLLRDLGFTVFSTVDSIEKVNDIVNICKKIINEEAK